MTFVQWIVESIPSLIMSGSVMACGPSQQEAGTGTLAGRSEPLDTEQSRWWEGATRVRLS
ncbi:hypothetical protein E2C01_087559 [Portunus trituberculatus]|uniref:Uncharacterized protein n=1 Tax=Portunus trituberculatus TaxID=210409 RepID=A0A5B7JHM5_PORTR|nr:hypothetical protein [Portunus trituberculatus]